MQSNLQVRKQNLLNAIIKGVDEYRFNKGKGNGNGRDYLGFPTYQEFANSQLNIVNQFNEDSLNTLELLLKVIPKTTFNDPGGGRDYDICGIAFDSNSGIVFIGCE